MTNSPDSTQPDDARLVIPSRSDDEAVTAYAQRVDAATEKLGQSAAQG